MSRFAEYVGRLSTMLGYKEHVHFVALNPGSSTVLHAVDDDFAPAVTERVTRIRSKDADAEAMAAYEAIDQMLRADRSSGQLRRAEDASDVTAEERSTGKLLIFPGATRPVEQEFGPFKQQAHVYGVPINVGGKRQIVNVNIRDGGLVHYCEATQDVALQIAPLLFRHTIRAYGTGQYFRDADGVWDMVSFRISHFDDLDVEPLTDTLASLRAITNRTGLPRDIIAKLDDLRGTED
jgi:hypothetical protein